MSPTVPDWTVHLAPGSDPGDLNLTGAGNLPRQWTRRWAADERAAALGDVDGRWLSAGELEQRTRAAALALRASGLAPRDRLAIGARSSAAFVVAYIGALRAGLTVVTLNLAYTEPEISAIIADARPAAALVDDDEKADWIRAAAGGELPVYGLDLAVRGGVGTDADGLDAAAPDDVALVIYTSGTTGRPKGVPLSHANLLASANAVNLAWR